MNDAAFDLIARYQEAQRSYNDQPENDALSVVHLGLMESIIGTDYVATSIDGALAALRLALAEERDAQVGGRTLTIALMEVALGYFSSAFSLNDPVINAMDAYHATNAAWRATEKPDGDLEASGPVYDAFEVAELAFVAEPCRSPADVQAKIKAVRDDDALSFAIRADLTRDAGSYFDVFVKSLDLSEPVDIGGN